MVGLYNVGRRSKKWWKRLFSHIVECSTLNAYILESHARPVQHALRGRNKRDFLKYRIELAHLLIADFSSRRRQAGRRLSEDSMNLEDCSIFNLLCGKPVLNLCMKIAMKESILTP